MNTFDVIDDLIKKYPEIKFLHITHFKEVKDFKSDLMKVWDENIETMFSKAMDIRMEHGVPFTSSLMLQNINNPNWSKHCLSTVSHHADIEYHKYPPDIHKIREELDVENDTWSICSYVELSRGVIRHIPMLDFRIGVNDTNTQIVEEVCHLINQTGYILNSGKSYHFIGDTLINSSERCEMLGKSLLLNPIIDDRWVAHQLRYFGSNLRISKKYNDFPQVITKV